MSCIGTDDARSRPVADILKKQRRGHCGLKKTKSRVEELKVIHSGKTVRLMFQDEADFGRINKPKYCFFLILPKCNTVCMNIFLRELSGTYPNDMILLCCDGAAWHKAGGLQIPENVELLHIPSYTPEMVPIEQIWQEIRKRGFRNEAFASPTKVMDRLSDTICSLSKQTASGITGREWIIRLFN